MAHCDLHNFNEQKIDRTTHTCRGRINQTVCRINHSLLHRGCTNLFSSDDFKKRLHKYLPHTSHWTRFWPFVFAAENSSRRHAAMQYQECVRVREMRAPFVPSFCRPTDFIISRADALNAQGLFVINIFLKRANDPPIWGIKFQSRVA